MGEMAEVFNAMKEYKRDKRKERIDEAEERLEEIVALLPAPYVLQRPSSGVYQIRRGTGRVVIQWWPSKRKWWETAGPILHGDIDQFKRYLETRTWL